MWTLTTTIRPLRDEATRALYWYGRRFPASFFNFVKRSFRVNDPYVRERMIAAAYGVAMARQYDFDTNEFVKEHLPYWSRFIYKTMFAPVAPCKTSHVLMRDYARHIIDIANLHHPALLTENELSAAHPPYDGDDIENWGQDAGSSNADEGRGPIRMDFGNYTLGKLVPDRGNYDDNHPEYSKLKAKAYWRIYDLGWSRDQFGEIDRQIQYAHSLSRQNEPAKTDRYGKKYSWIAFFELYGHRRDHKALDEWGERSSEVDIDPSFPEPPLSQQLLDRHWLGSSEIETTSWIEDGDIPDLESFAVREEILGEEGPWVLLNARYNYDDEDRSRNLWFRICGIVSNITELGSDELEEILREQINSGTFTPGGYYTFAGEVPWADSFPENEEQSLSVQRGDKGAYGIQILPAAWQNEWESHHAAITSGPRGEVPARQVCKVLKLISQPQTYDLFDATGGRATIASHCEKKQGAIRQDQRCLYLRKDLLDRYLKETDQILLIWMDGERQHSVRTFTAEQQSDQVSEPYRKNFNRLLIYGRD